MGLVRVRTGPGPMSTVEAGKVEGTAIQVVARHSAPRSLAPRPPSRALDRAHDSWSSAAHAHVDTRLLKVNLSRHPVPGRGHAAQLHGECLATDVERMLVNRLRDLTVSIH